MLTMVTALLPINTSCAAGCSGNLPSLSPHDLRERVPGKLIDLGAKGVIVVCNWCKDPRAVHFCSNFCPRTSGWKKSIKHWRCENHEVASPVTEHASHPPHTTHHAGHDGNRQVERRAERSVFTCSQGLTHELDIYNNISEARVIVVYLPSTTLEAPRSDLARDAHATVVCPVIERASRKPWKQQLPEWVCEWVSHTQTQWRGRAWSLMGFSRGASWGLRLVACLYARELFFDRVLLVAPFLAPCWDEQLVADVKAALLDERVGRRTTLVWGELDHWQEPQLWALRGAVMDVQRIPGVDHEGSLDHVYRSGLVDRLILKNKIICRH